MLLASKFEKDMNADSVMDNIRNAFERSEMTLTELGQGLGYEGPTAKKRAWFLLYRTANPRISTVLSCGPHVGCQNERSRQMRKACVTCASLKLVPFVTSTAAPNVP